MIFDIITLFPEMFAGPLTESILKRAQDNDLITINIHQLRNWGIGPHKQVDDTVYGGGVGMLLRPDVVIPAITEVKKTKKIKKTKILLMTPQGQTFKQQIAEDLAKEDRLIIVCGHYAGFDERIRKFVDLEVSIGDYVLTGGEVPAMVVIDAVSRQISGVVGRAGNEDESFSKSLDRKMEYPQYTKPEIYNKLAVPDILLSGHHAEIEKWRSSKTR
ncbi:MAG: tRNA (guanine-N(1)-)-methyltransferase [Berkelbacteria bacterium GW2011_GWA2_38_9]|uniref:tRNA (guanine-N(1)-)-methyltransferase n=1 Tax=Berkelbacteria bacterium GW2011_GWA2_38_9 TaxID=1618334 RepID=A0A0G0NXP6_9BACT|nr:MAG: tRNA (guanine-N(1)-)-methyltransferase [Berkelbacteria bacterium GW2011_GWA2_38_9]